MDALLQLLLFGGLMFLMMRFGCGAHMSGHRRKHGTQDGAKNGGCCATATGNSDPAAESEAGNAVTWAPPEKDRDPVCGETVLPAKAKSTVHDGQVFYFCSRDCREIFEAAPGLYPAKEKAGVVVSNRGRSRLPSPTLQTGPAAPSNRR